MRLEFYGSNGGTIHALMHVRVDGRDHLDIPARSADGECYTRALDVVSLDHTRGLRVHAVYDGCWAFAAGQRRFRELLPSWVVSVQQEDGCSTRLVVDTGAEKVEVVRADSGRLYPMDA